jgi:hypothetical protein
VPRLRRSAHGAGREVCPQIFPLEERRPVPAQSLSIQSCPSSNGLGQSDCLETEALARLGLSLGGFQLVLQSSLFDGVAFDPFSFQEDCAASAEVNVGRRQVL